MRILWFISLLTVPTMVMPALPQALESVPATAAPSLVHPLAELQSRFAVLQQKVRPDNAPFELRLVIGGAPLLGQSDDGLIRLSEDWVAAAPDGDTLDFLILLALSDAISRESVPSGPDRATKVVTGVLGYVGYLATQRNRPLAVIPSSGPRFAERPPALGGGPATRALNWTTIVGGCEARVVAGLRKMQDANAIIGREARQILKSLGAIAWTPNDRCRSSLP